MQTEQLYSPAWTATRKQCMPALYRHCNKTTFDELSKIRGSIYTPHHSISAQHWTFCSTNWPSSGSTYISKWLKTWMSFSNTWWFRYIAPAVRHVFLRRRILEEGGRRMREEEEGKEEGEGKRKRREGTWAHTTECIHLLHIVQVDWLWVQCSIFSCAIFNLIMFSVQSAVIDHAALSSLEVTLKNLSRLLLPSPPYLSVLRGYSMPWSYASFTIRSLNSKTVIPLATMESISGLQNYRRVDNWPSYSREARRAVNMCTNTAPRAGQAQCITQLMMSQSSTIRWTAPSSSTWLSLRYHICCPTLDYMV